MLLCLSHSRTLVTLDDLGVNYDEDVRQWQANVSKSLMREVSILFRHILYTMHIALIHIAGTY